MERTIRMRFRDNKLWSAWPLLLICAAGSLYLTKGMCKDIAERPLLWKDAYAVTIWSNLLWQVLAGILLWCAFHALSVYEIGPKGIRCRVFPGRHWTIVPWADLTHGGLYSRWTGETENFIYFSNYRFNGDNLKAPMNNGDMKDVLFTIPLSRRGMKAIRTYVPNEQLRLLANSPWLWKSKYARELNAIFEERGLFPFDKAAAEGNGEETHAEGGEDQ